MNVVTLTIPTGASMDQHCVLLGELERHVLARPDVLDLRLGGESSMAPSTAAAYCALICSLLSAGGEVVTSAVTPLSGPAALVWLLGSVRRVHPGGYLLFSSSHTGKVAEPEYSHVGGERNPARHPSGPEAACYARLLRRADCYLRIDAVLDEPLFEEQLCELLLVGPVASADPPEKRSPSSNVRAPDHGFWREPEPPASHLSP